MKQTKRQTIFVDKSVQGALAVRVAAYWLLCLTGTFGLLAGFPIAISCFYQFPNAPTTLQLLARTWSTFWPVLAATLLIVPAVLWDVVNLSSRFVGPVYRLRASMRDLAEGKEVRPIKFRDGDFWCEFAEEFNRVAQRVAEANPADPVSTDPVSAGTEAAAVEEAEELEEPVAV